MTFVAGVQQPHSEAELAAHVLVLEEFNRELAVYNEAVEAFEQATRPQKQHQPRGQKRSRFGQGQGPNGNPITNNINEQQTREHARCYDSPFLNQPLVHQTPNLAPEANYLGLEPYNVAAEPNILALPAVTLLGDEFLIAINSSNNLNQLSMIRTLGREQLHVRTTPKCRDAIAILTINGLNGKVDGEGTFRLWRQSELTERIMVKLDLKDSGKYTKTAEEILLTVFKINKLRGGFTDATTNTDFRSKHRAQGGPTVAPEWQLHFLANAGGGSPERVIWPEIRPL
jgi:hypothetical protein